MSGRGATRTKRSLVPPPLIDLLIFLADDKHNKDNLWETGHNITDLRVTIALFGVYLQEKGKMVCPTFRRRLQKVTVRGFIAANSIMDTILVMSECQYHVIGILLCEQSSCRFRHVKGGEKIEINYHPPRSNVHTDTGTLKHSINVVEREI